MTNPQAEKMAVETSTGGETMAESSSAFLNSVVTVFATSIEPDFCAPWDQDSPSFGRGSGFIIADPRDESKRLVVTNAHCVDSATELYVRKFQSDEKVPATILTQVIDCDVAVLSVEDEEFWLGESGSEKLLPCFEFGALPKIQDEVRVVGYPEHGTEVSVTSGNVSRIQHQEYVHSGISLLSMQTTALIASGNSGGPVINGRNEVVGIAFQGTERVGEFIPVCVFERFLQFPGKGSIVPIQTVAGAGFLWEKVESKALQTSLGLHKLSGTKKTGIRVSHVAASGEIAEALRPGDVIVDIDGVSVGNVGTIILDGNRVGFMHLITSKAVGDSIDVGIVRNGECKNVSWTLASADSSALVPKYDRMKSKGCAPDYVIIGGLVFVGLCEQLFSSIEDDVGGMVMMNLINYANFGFKENESEEIVVVSKVIPNEALKGYEPQEIQGRVVSSFNGRRVKSLTHFAELYSESVESEVEFFKIGLGMPNFPISSQVVVSRKQVEDGEEELLAGNRIPSSTRIGGDGGSEMDEDDAEGLVRMDSQGNLALTISPCEECGHKPVLEADQAESMAEG